MKIGETSDGVGLDDLVHRPERPGLDLNEHFKAVEDHHRKELRDRFAMAALAGFLGGRSSSIADLDECAEFCYRLADAALRAREVK